MKSLLLALFLIFTTTTTFAQDLTLEERVSNLEQKILDIGSYVEQNCDLVQEYAGSSSMGCFDSSVTSIRTTLNQFGNNIYVNNWLECKRYRLICR